MARFVPRGRAAAKIDFRPQRAPLHSRRQLHVCASAQARGAGRDPSARDECAVAPFAWICRRFVSHDRGRQDRFPTPSRPQRATPCPEVVVLAARPALRLSRRFGAIRAADSCARRQARSRCNVRLSVGAILRAPAHPGCLPRLYGLGRRAQQPHKPAPRKLPVVRSAEL